MQFYRSVARVCDENSDKAANNLVWLLLVNSRTNHTLGTGRTSTGRLAPALFAKTRFKNMLFLSPLDLTLGIWTKDLGLGDFRALRLGMKLLGTHVLQDLNPKP